MAKQNRSSTSKYEHASALHYIYIMYEGISVYLSHCGDESALVVHKSFSAGSPANRTMNDTMNKKKIKIKKTVNPYAKERRTSFGTETDVRNARPSLF